LFAAMMAQGRIWRSGHQRRRLDGSRCGNAARIIFISA
jgi:hypothetical protein